MVLVPHTENMSEQNKIECANVKRLFERERERSGMTQATLARMVKKSPKTISAVVNGRMRVTVELGNAFAKVFGVPLVSILPWTATINTDNNFADVIADLEQLTEENRKVALRMIRNLLDSQE